MGKKGTSKWFGLYKPGDKVGKWNILSEVYVKREARVKARCECGFEGTPTVLTLKKGLSNSCYTCSTKDKIGIGNPVWTGYKEIPGKFFYRMKKGAEKRGISFDIDIEYVQETYKMSGKICALSNIPISIETGNASVDRIDSSLGYEEGNIQWVHKDINFMKRTYSQQYFIDMCRGVADHCEIR